MKKSELLIIIEYIVDKKIKQIINNNINEIINKKLNNIIDNKIKILLKEDNNVLTKKLKNDKIIKKQQNFSKNPIINDILNDTAKQGYVSYQEEVSQEEPNNNIPGFLNEVFSKNYSGVLKKMEEKSKSIRSKPDLNTNII